MLKFAQPKDKNSAKPEFEVKQGSFWVDVDTKELYILARTSVTDMVLINLKTGNRWSDAQPVDAERSTGLIPESDWAELTFNGDFIPAQVDMISAIGEALFEGDDE